MLLKAKKSTSPPLGQTVLQIIQGYVVRRLVVLFLCSELNMQDILRESPHLVKIVLCSVYPLATRLQTAR